MARKLQKLADALQKRPQLKLDVQGRFSTAADGAALKARDVRQTLAMQLGIELKPGEAPGPVDFSSRDVRKALEKLVEARFGTETLKKLKDSVEKAKAIEADKLAKELFAQLVASEPLPEAVLVELAMARARAVVDELTSQGDIAKDRVSIQSPKPLKEGEPVTVKLALDAVEQSS